MRSLTYMKIKSMQFEKLNPLPNPPLPCIHKGGGGSNYDPDYWKETTESCQFQWKQLVWPFK